VTIIKTYANKTGVDLTNYTGYAVKFDTDGINICSAITDQAIGVVTSGGATQSDVCILGECQAIAGAAATAGKYLIPHTDGKVKNTAASSQEFALAIEAAVAGDWFSVFVYGSPKTQS